MRDYLVKYVPGSGNLPSGDALRRMSLCLYSENEAIKEQLKEKSVIIVANELSDKQRKKEVCTCSFIWNYWFRVKTVMFFGNWKFVDAVNSTCCQAVLHTL